MKIYKGQLRQEKETSFRDLEIGAWFRFVDSYEPSENIVRVKTGRLRYTYLNSETSEPFVYGQLPLNKIDSTVVRINVDIVWCLADPLRGLI